MLLKGQLYRKLFKDHFDVCKSIYVCVLVKIIGTTGFFFLKLELEFHN